MGILHKDIAKLKAHLMDQNSHPDSTFTCLDDHDGFMDQLEHTDPENLSLEDQIAVFGYLQQYVLTQSKADGLITERSCISPINEREYIYPAVNEEAFPREIREMTKLQARFGLSKTLKDAIANITDLTARSLDDIPEFKTYLSQWQSADHPEMTNIASGCFWVIDMHAENVFERKFSIIPLNLNVPYDPNLPDYGYGGPDKDKPHVLWNPGDNQHFDTSKCLSLLIHEKIHAIYGRLAAIFQKEGTLGNADLDRDAQINILRRKYNAITQSEIQSLYFTDPEEEICYANQMRIEEFLEGLLQRSVMAAENSPHDKQVINVQPTNELT